MERPLTNGIPAGGAALGLSAYRSQGGYKALARALKLAPHEITKTVKEANLRGRGGAGFVTGTKWSFVPMGPDAPHPKYLVANADEMEPGTFKDRLLLECNPHLLIEGMIISAYAIGADVAWVFLRWEYHLAAARLRHAIGEAYAAGLLGHDILHSGFGLELHLHVSAGRYMCGEETGLLSALEGKRALPRAKPPYPQVSGLWGKPTIVQNVETLCCVPGIVRDGPAAFLALSKTEDGGSKLYGVSGKVKRPGLWELPMGTTAREILFVHAGGMREGLRLRGFLPGGASTDFLTEEHLDVPLDFAHPPQVGSRLGTGTLIVLDDHTCPVGMMHNLLHFFAQESCGFCTPCRDGLPWLTRLLAALERGEGRRGDLEILEQHTQLLGPGHTFCALAPGAMEPLQSALKFFRDDFEAHLTKRGCPYGES